MCNQNNINKISKESPFHTNYAKKKIHFTETNSKQFIHVNEFNPLGIKKWCCIQTIIFKSENRWTYTGTKSNPVNKPAKEIVLLFSKPP